MTCGKCRANIPDGTAFCSNCGNRLVPPPVGTKREYNLTEFAPSWWRYTMVFLMVVIVAAIAASEAVNRDRNKALDFAAIGFILIGVTALRRAALRWSLTSERLIERQGLLARRRREMELADIRAVEVERRLLHRIVGIGTVTVASAASSEYEIVIGSVRNPEAVASTIREARMKRIA